MRQQINNLISVAYTLPRLFIMKMLHGNNFKSGFIERFSPNVVLEINSGAHVSFGEKVRIHSGSKIKVRSGARLDIGHEVHFNYYCIVVCHNHISIGEGTEFGPSVYLYDHDHDYRGAPLSKLKFKSSPISIGENCWVGANTVILRGTKLGNNCVVGAGSILRGEYPDDSIILQKGETRVETIGGRSNGKR